MTELLGIRYPIMCGAMLWLAEPHLCAAVSNAGGLGNLTAANYNNGEELRAAIHEVRELTDKPFSVNVTLLPSFRITNEIYDSYFRVCAEEHVPVMDISGRPATKYIDQMHKAGTVMMHKIGSIKHAKNIERLGYDAVISLGFEAGGHPHSDNVPTSVLVPRMCDSVDLPVIVAGGMSDGRGLAAALSLGGCGVLMASRFAATKECIAHPNIKQELVNRQEMDTTLICKSLNLQCRALKNALTQQVLDIEAQNGPADQIFPLITGARGLEAYKTGDATSAALAFGESIGLIYDVPSCAEVIERTVKQAEQIIQSAVACFA